MSLRGPIVIGAVALFAVLGFYLFQRQLANVWLSLALAGEVRQIIDRSAEDQKALRRLDPAREEEYRRRFDEIEAMRRRLTIVSISREDLAARLQTLLIAGFLVVGIPVLLLGLAARRSLDRRLTALREALVSLSRGEPPESTARVRGRDTLGRISAMIESTYRQMKQDRQRLDSLRHLEQWQEAARRHAHEIRTPLTAARIDLDRLAARVVDADAQRIIGGIRQDFDQLQTFTREFTSFAAIGKPRLESVDIRAFLREFCDTFAAAWPQLAMRVMPGETAQVVLDREMIRRVLMNLASNAAKAVTSASGTLLMDVRVAEPEVVEVHVIDDGAGVADPVRETLFDPYVTTRPVGDGMGLGLAIARKILLDHGGDLRLAGSRSGETEFVLILPRREENAC